MQRVPHPGYGQHFRPVSLGDLHGPCRHPPADDGPAVLPYARPGTPCDGGRGPAHRLQKRRGRSGFGSSSARDVQPGQGRSRRCLRILGRLRRGHQCGAVSGHCHRVHAPGPGALGIEQSDDRPGPGQHRQGGRPPLLQAGFLPGHSGRRGLCTGTPGGVHDADRPRLHLFEAEQPVHWQTLPLCAHQPQTPQGGLPLRP